MSTVKVTSNRDATNRPGSIAILIPCYNEELIVGEVVRNFSAEVPAADIYVFDNNSSDGTVEEARRTAASARDCTPPGSQLGSYSAGCSRSPSVWFCIPSLDARRSLNIICCFLPTSWATTRRDVRSAIRT